MSDSSATVRNPESPVQAFLNLHSYVDLFADIGKCKRTGKDMRICYNIFGDRNNPCILLIQGIGTSLLGFSLEFVNMFIQAGFCVVRYDNRDCGLSTRFPELSPPSIVRYVIPEWASIGEKIPYTIEEMMEDGIGLLTAIGIEKAHIFGMSMGGMIAQLMAIHYPDRVLSLNILFTHMGGNDRIEPPLLDLVVFLKRPKNDTNEEKINQTIEFIQFLSQGQYEYDPVLMHEYFTNVLQRNGSVTVAEPRQIAALMRSSSRKEALKKLQCPTLVMHGLLDPLIPVKNGYLLAETIPNAKLVIFPRLGHTFPPELHQQVADYVIRNARRAGTMK